MDIFKNYDVLWKNIIRPTRQVYSLSDMGSSTVITRNREKVRRVDFEIPNKVNLSLKCSFFEFFERSEPQPCVMYLHCNSGSRLEGIPYVENLLNNNMCVCIFDFAGSGNSEGDYIFLGFHEVHDVEVVIKYITDKFKISKIALWGRSMGAVTGLLSVSSADMPSSIVCGVFDSPFSNFRKLAVEIGQAKTGLPKFIVKGAINLISSTIVERAAFSIEDLNLISCVGNSRTPALFVASKKDGFVKCHHSEKLAKAYNQSLSTLIYFDGDHNEKRPHKTISECIHFIKTHFTNNGVVFKGEHAKILPSSSIAIPSLSVPLSTRPPEHATGSYNPPTSPLSKDHPAIVFQTKPFSGAATSNKITLMNTNEAINQLRKSIDVPSSAAAATAGTTTTRFERERRAVTHLSQIPDSMKVQQPPFFQALQNPISPTLRLSAFNFSQPSSTPTNKQMRGEQGSQRFSENSFSLSQGINCGKVPTIQSNDQLSPPTFSQVQHPLVKGSSSMASFIENITPTSSHSFEPGQLQKKQCNEWFATRAIIPPVNALNTVHQRQKSGKESEWSQVSLREGEDEPVVSRSMNTTSQTLIKSSSKSGLAQIPHQFPAPIGLQNNNNRFRATTMDQPVSQPQNTERVTQKRESSFKTSLNSSSSSTTLLVTTPQGQTQNQFKDSANTSQPRSAVTASQVLLAKHNNKSSNNNSSSNNSSSNSSSSNCLNQRQSFVYNPSPSLGEVPNHLGYQSTGQHKSRLQDNVLATFLTPRESKINGPFPSLQLMMPLTGFQQSGVTSPSLTPTSQTQQCEQQQHQQQQFAQPSFIRRSQNFTNQQQQQQQPSDEQIIIPSQCSSSASLLTPRIQQASMFQPRAHFGPSIKQTSAQAVGGYSQQQHTLLSKTPQFSFFADRSENIKQQQQTGNSPLASSTITNSALTEIIPKRTRIVTNHKACESQVFQEGNKSAAQTTGISSALSTRILPSETPQVLQIQQANTNNYKSNIYQQTPKQLFHQHSQANIGGSNNTSTLNNLHQMVTQRMSNLPTNEANKQPELSPFDRVYAKNSSVSPQNRLAQVNNNNGSYTQNNYQLPLQHQQQNQQHQQQQSDGSVSTTSSRQQSKFEFKNKRSTNNIPVQRIKFTQQKQNENISPADSSLQQRPPFHYPRSEQTEINASKTSREILQGIQLHCLTRPHPAMPLKEQSSLLNIAEANRNYKINAVEVEAKKNRSTTSPTFIFPDTARTLPNRNGQQQQQQQQLSFNGNQYVDQQQREEFPLRSQQMHKQASVNSFQQQRYQQAEMR